MHGQLLSAQPRLNGLPQLAAFSQGQQKFVHLTWVAKGALANKYIGDCVCYMLLYGNFCALDEILKWITLHYIAYV